jgi:hypothetical protein
MPGGTYFKFDSDFPNDAQWDSLLKAQRSELDAEKRVALLKEIQRYHAGRMYTIHRPASPRLPSEAAMAGKCGRIYLTCLEYFRGKREPSTAGLHWWLDK